MSLKRESIKYNEIDKKWKGNKAQTDKTECRETEQELAKLKE